MLWDTMNNFIHRKLNRILNDKEKNDCDGQLTVTEYSEAIGNMKLYKYSCLDGLTVEF